MLKKEKLTLTKRDLVLIFMLFIGGTHKVPFSDTKSRFGALSRRG